MRAIIFGNGEWPTPKIVQSYVKKGDKLIACDGGYAKAKKIGIIPHVIIGDLDSLSSIPIPRSVQVHAFPREKDESDAELALLFALKLNPSEIVWFGALGDRPDHTLANLFLLEHVIDRGIPIRIVHRSWSIQVISKSLMIRGRRGDRVSLIPISNSVRGITTRGLRYPLRNGTLMRSKTRGVSNELMGAGASVRLRSGRLLVFHEQRRGN